MKFRLPLSDVRAMFQPLLDPESVPPEAGDCVVRDLTEHLVRLHSFTLLEAHRLVFMRYEYTRGRYPTEEGDPTWRWEVA